MRRGIIFDVDGTLWDSGPQVTQAWNEVLSQYPQVNRQITTEEMYRYMGHTMDELGRMMLPKVDAELRTRIMNQCMEYENEYLADHPGTLYPGVREVLENLSKNWELYIVSNCQTGYIEVLLSSCHLGQWIRDIECYGRTGKPKGENIRFLMERNGLEDAFYVGDTAMDEEACRIAAIPFIHAAYGFGRANAPAATITALCELSGAAETLWETYKKETETP